MNHSAGCSAGVRAGFSRAQAGRSNRTRNGVPRTAALAVERERFVDLFDGADQREGVNAFLEKRAPKWQGAQSKESQR